ncbi:helix-turn-helix domain-containing protein [Microbacterium sp. P02]|uniref:helix-turn-helix domain-containing protein n=1 Tax=unclassified Microbacterium TaxID=2609290 RepID=UPI00366DD779
MYVRDGFLGQRLRVLSAPLAARAATSPLTDRLLVTDAGYFPHAAAHGRSRPRGAAQAIVIICASGAGWLELEDTPPVRIEAGAAAVIPAGRPHRYRADGNDPWSIWWVHATGPDVDELVTEIVRDDDPVVRLRDSYSAIAGIDEALTAMEDEETTAALYVASGAAWRLFAQLAADRLRGPALTNDRMEIVQQYLRSHLSSSLSVAELARLAGLSASHFSALFKATAGIPVVEYIKRLRSARARELLITTDRSVTEIGEAVGYADPFYFSRQFRSINGVSPTVFRARSRDEPAT